MKELEVWPGDEIRATIRRALPLAPCFFVFNGCRIEVLESMKNHPDAYTHLYSVYNAWLQEEAIPAWNIKPAEKPCKSCGRNNFITDNKCWWCETANPCT